MELLSLSVVSLVSIAAIGLYLWWLRKNDDYWEKRGVPYEPRNSFVYGIYMFYTKPMHEIFLELQRKYGRIYGAFEGRKPILTVSEPELLRDILVKDFHIFNYRRDFPIGDEEIAKMVSILKGEDWKRIRTIISPAFTSRRMRQISHIINGCSQTVLTTFGKYAEQGNPVDCKSIFGAFTMDVIAVAAFATKIDSHNDPENIFVQEVKKFFIRPSIFRLIVFFCFPLWLIRIFRLELFANMDFFKDVVKQVVKERREKGKKHDDILQLLMDAQDELEAENLKEQKKNDINEDETDRYGSITSNGIINQQKYKKMTENELVAQCVLFFIVGYETTASVLSYAAYSLALNPECQEKLIQEIDEAFEKHKELNYDVIRDMKYLDCVVSETLRMYPSLTRSERTACEDYVLGNTGIVIEKGTIVGFNIHAMHYDPEFFPNPEKFEPERFMDENANHPQYAYLPFGAGPRNCLGMRFALMEIKICISNILRHYRLKKAETTKVPLEFKVSQGFLSVNEIPLLVEKRNK